MKSCTCLEAGKYWLQKSFTSWGEYV